MAFWIFTVFNIIPAIYLFIVDTPLPNKKSGTSASRKGQLWTYIFVVFGCFTLGVYVGAETGFGSFVLVYAKL